MQKILEFRVMYCGWEMDDLGWIVEDDDGEKKILLTSHGQEYIAEPDELLDSIAEYQDVIEETKQALALFWGIDRPSEL